MRSQFHLIVIALACVATAACGSKSGGDDDGDGDGTGIPDANHFVTDADPTRPDANPADCTGGTQCSDCLDNDNDGYIDGDDIECTGGADDDEGSFATGIPGDNVDTVKQDCFFDGNSGSGNDGCEQHVCCLLGAPDQASCDFHPSQYNPAECGTGQSQQCIDYCGALTPPGCDCFGCCTICDPVTDECFDIITNPSTAPNCDQEHIGDPTACPVCLKNDSCGSVCDPANCILCPGQGPEDLPPECTTQACPNGETVCADNAGACGASEYCSNGCCIAIIE